MVEISTNAHIIGTALLNTAVNVSCFLRIWIQRRRPSRGSVASRVSSGLYYAVIFVTFFQTCTIYYRLSRVKRIEDDHSLTPEQKLFKMLDPEILLCGYIEIVGLAFDLYLLKGAFVAMYYDLAAHLSKIFLWSLHALSVVTIVGFIVTFIATAVWCRPIETNWLGGPQSCNPMLRLTPVNILTWYSVANDILLVIFASALIRSLKLSGRDIWALGVVFLIGFISIAATVIRYLVVYDWIRDVQGTDPKTTNVVEFWASIEVVMAVLCFTLPTFRAALRRRSSKQVTQASYGYGTSNKGSRFGASELGTMNGDDKYYNGLGHELEVQMCNSFEVSSKKASTDSLTPSHHVHVATKGMGLRA